MNVVSQAVSFALAAIVALVKAKNWNELLVACTKLIAAGTTEARVYFFAGLACWKLGKRHDAIPYFSLALQLDPNVDNASYAHTCIALTYRRSATRTDGSVDPALMQAAANHFHQAAQLDPEGRHGDHPTSVAGCLAVLGRLEEAITWYDWALDHGCQRPEECLFNKAMCLNALDRHAESYETFRLLAERNPQHGQAKLWMAKLALSAEVGPAQSCPAQTIDAALPALEQLVQEAQTALQDTRCIYIVRPNQPAIRRDASNLKTAVEELAEAHGVAAVALVYQQDWAKVETHIRASYVHGVHSETVGYALWLCKEYEVPESTDLYIRITAEFGIPSRRARLGLASRSFVDINEESGYDLGGFGSGSDSDWDLSISGDLNLGGSNSDSNISALDPSAEFNPMAGLGVSPSDSNIPVAQNLSGGQHFSGGIVFGGNSVNNLASSTASASGITDAMMV